MTQQIDQNLYREFLKELYEKWHLIEKGEHNRYSYEAETMHIIYTQLRTDGFRKICGASGEYYSVNRIKDIVGFLKELNTSSFFCQEGERRRVLILLEKVLATSARAPRGPMETAEEEFFLCDRELQKIGIDALLECFVAALRYKYDQDEALWDEFRMTMLFRK